ADLDPKRVVPPAQPRRQDIKPLYRRRRNAPGRWYPWRGRLGEGDRRADDRRCAAMSDTVVARSEESIAKGSQSFAAAARLFDRDTREDAVMLYAWCRHCDDVIDGQEAGHGQAEDFRIGQQQRLMELRQKTAAALAGEATDEYIFEAL